MGIESRGPLLPAALVALIPAIALVFADNYLLFHTFVELFVAAVALVVFSIAWHTRKIASNDYLTFFGMSSLPFAAVMIVHALSYKGMPTFPQYGADLPTQMWLIARVIQASAFVAAPVYVLRRLKQPLTALIIYSAIAAVLVGAAFARWLPAAFIEGVGLTPFKVGVEYAVMASIAVGMVGLYSVRRHVERDVARLLHLAMGLTILSELCFTLYTSPFGMANRIGHVGHVGAFILIYGALVQSSLEKPLTSLFTKLKSHEAELARAFEVQHDIAETLQSAMAVQPQRVKGLDLAHRYLAAKGLGRIGGDFYDVFHIEGNQVGFLIGDVCGKGLTAATTTLKVRSAVRAISLSEPDPAEVLGAVNTYLINELDDGKFVTAVYGTIDVATGRMRVAVAGHPDPIVCGRPELAPPQRVRSTPLGVREPLGATTHEVTLRPGDSIVLVTDGVTEAKGEQDRFGDERLSGLLHTCANSESAEAVLDRLLGALNEHTNSASDDDMALLALRFSPDAAAA